MIQYAIAKGYSKEEFCTNLQALYDDGYNEMYTEIVTIVNKQNRIIYLKALYKII